MEIIPYGEKLKAGLIGVVAPDGTFYAIAKTGTLSACHQEELRKLSILLSKNQPCNTLGSLFYKKREQIEHPEEFYLGDTFDYKVGFIDLWGFCNYESSSRPNSFAAIMVPRYEINQKKITNRQTEVLTELVRLNRNSPDSLNILFYKNDKRDRMVQKEAMLPKRTARVLEKKYTDSKGGKR